MTVLIIAAVVILVIIVGMKQFGDTKKLAEDGKIIQRDGQFFQEKEIFKTDATYEEIRKTIAKIDFSDAKAAVTPDFEGARIITFQSADRWLAVLEARGEKEGKNIFEFYFHSWRTGRYGVVNTVSMNALVTAIERIMLSLDPAVTVESHKMQIKSKAKFF